MIDEIGVAGQKKLLASSVLIVGCGGLASAVIPLIAGSGVGNITLVDDDIIELSNLNRQVIYKTADISSKKVDKAKKFINELNPDVSVRALSFYINTRNFDSVLKDVDLVIDCADRLAVKLLIHDACLTICRPLIYSTAIGFMGQVLTIPIKGKPCLRCFFEKKKMKSTLNCANAAVFSPILGIIGSLVAAETIKYLLGIESSLIGGLQLIDLKNHRFNLYRFKANENCIGCGNNIQVDPYDDSNYESMLQF